MTQMIGEPPDPQHRTTVPFRCPTHHPVGGRRNAARPNTVNSHVVAKPTAWVNLGASWLTPFSLRC
jgi:hypothetical protein